jgi:hypothetical protein
MPPVPRDRFRGVPHHARVRCQMVLRGCWREVFALPNGELGELTLVWGTRSAWTRRTEARAAGWRTLPIGPFLLAYRIQV